MGNAFTNLKELKAEFQGNGAIREIYIYLKFLFVTSDGKVCILVTVLLLLRDTMT